MCVCVCVHVSGIIFDFFCSSEQARLYELREEEDELFERESNKIQELPTPVRIIKSPLISFSLFLYPSLPPFLSSLFFFTSLNSLPLSPFSLPHPLPFSFFCLLLSLSPSLPPSLPPLSLPQSPPVPTPQGRSLRSGRTIETREEDEDEEEEGVRGGTPPVHEGDSDSDAIIDEAWDTGRFVEINLTVA